MIGLHTVIGLVIEIQCNYFAPLAFPDRVAAGICVTRLGNSSVRYKVGIFKETKRRLLHKDISFMYMSVVTRAGLL